MSDHIHDHAYQHAHGIAHTHGHVHENQKAVVNRLARAIGHLEKVKRMVEEGYDCSEVLVQLAAVRSALSGLYMTVSAPSVMSSADNAVSEETMYRAFSRALADSDLGGDIELDGDVLYSAMVNRNRRNTRITGVNAMA